ncbi:hypothetical protein ANCCAN_25504 [Ancylostoma caninum]|uniref:Uncharacterized protein n=1 Tax=Ancylostoma caninum TaxID=29170 RepID=A0A368F9A9_ANCCA|nr:hypothetical protein ANCCAN_25504 [Ancylostoma caninum]
MLSTNQTLLLLLSFLVHVIGESSPGSEEQLIGGIEGDVVNETDVTMLINSSFVIVEQPENNHTEVDAAIGNAMLLSKRARVRKVMPACRTFSLSEKYRMLEGVGGRNQLYMAETPEEASRGFVPPSPAPKMKAVAADSVDASESSEPFCNQECEMIRVTLEKALEERRKPKPAQQPAGVFRAVAHSFSDPGPLEVDDLDGAFSGGNKVCSLETFVPLGNCTEPGEEVSWAHEQLCSMCRGIYMLSENCFPTFFNSVLCNQQETGCIFDNFSDRAHGLCRSETLSLRVLRNRGDPVCEDWVVEQIEVRMHQFHKMVT